MAVIVSNGATNLSTASGFYRAESYNLSSFSTTTLVLSTTRTIAVTFANAGNCKGLIIPISSSTGNCTKDVTVTLQEYVTGVWTDRVSKTLTANNISNTTATTQAIWWTPFEFGTPYAVDTTASKWRFQIAQGSGSGNWYMLTSNGSAPAYVTWCDNAVTYASGDIPVAKEKITIDMNCTFTGVLSTGDSTNSVCAIACKSSTPSVGNDAMFEWQNAPSASYTMNINGWFVLSAHSGFRCGTEASPIPIAQQANIIIKSASLGTVANTGFSSGVTSSSASYSGRMTIYMHGEVPTYQHTTLSADASSGQQDIVTTDTTGWAIGDEIMLSKYAGAGVTSEVVPYTIDTISGTNINVNTNIATTRLAGGHVIRLNGYGVVFKSEFTNTYPSQYLGGSNGVKFTGVQIQNVLFHISTGTSAWYDDAANINTLNKVEDCSIRGYGTDMNLFGSINFSSLGNYLFNRCNFFRAGTTSTVYGPALNPLTVTNCVFIRGTIHIGGSFRSNGGTFSGNYFYHAQSQAISVSLGLYNATIENNYFWGLGQACIRVDGPLVSTTWRNNTINSVSVVFWNFASMINVTISGDSYGVDRAVTTVAVPYATYNSYWSQVVIKDVTIGTVTNQVTGQSDSVDGSSIGFQNYDNLAKDDATYLTYGTIVRTHSTLADTTVRTAGGSAMRFAPNSSTNLMHWEQKIPTGDITSKTMTITCWVKINSATYYAGTHTKPTLTVTYDQTSTVSSVATTGTGWQQLACTFTPSTAYGEVEMKITGNTDATGTNAYFYVDDFNIAYPAGVQVNLGGLDLWANGLPVAPAIATMPSITGVWDEPMTAHTIVGSYGLAVNETNNNAEITMSKVDTL